MNAPTKPTEPAGHPLGVGATWYQVLQPQPIVGPHGETQYAMFGPFADMPAAAGYANAKPGSFVCVTLILDQATGAPATKFAPFKAAG